MGKSFYYFNQLPVGYAVLSYKRIWIKLKIQPLHQFRRASAKRLFIDKSGLCFITPDKNIFGNGHIFDLYQFLMHHAGSQINGINRLCNMYLVSVN